MSQPIKPHHIGKRLLLTDGYTYIERDEVIVVELSPSGDNVKLRRPHGGEMWQRNDEWESRVLEELPDVALAPKEGKLWVNPSP